MATAYFSRWLLLDTGDVCENGAVVVDGNRIASVGHRSAVKRSSEDRLVNLGNTLLMPGLVDMHTHLEECVVRGTFKAPEETFASFSVKKNARVRQTPAEAVRAGIKLEVRELLTAGITAVLDSSRFGHSAAVLSGEPIRSWVVHEAQADDLPQDEVAAEALAALARSPQPGVGAGIGPHTLFSLSPHTQRRVIELASANGWLWASHVAESAEELQAFSERAGDLYFTITRKKPWPFGETIMGSAHFALTNNLVPNNGICFHCNYASTHELSLLAAKRAPVVLCYQYSEELGHKRFPLEVALNRGVCLCLGTEGVMPAGETSMLDELFAVKQVYPHIPAAQMLRWVTANPATALKMGHELGSLTQGKLADMIAVRFPHDPKEDILEELLLSDVEMALVMVDGQELIADY